MIELAARPASLMLEIMSSNLALFSASMGVSGERCLLTAEKCCP